MDTPSYIYSVVKVSVQLKFSVAKIPPSSYADAIEKDEPSTVTANNNANQPLFICASLQIVKE
jgi:hypothetical protein